MKSKIEILLIVLLFPLFFINGCKDKSNVIPYAYVDFNVYLSDPQFFNLNAVGNAVTVTGGVRGIIIYRKSNDEFKAYDRDCTYKPSDPCETVNIDSTKLFAKCPCCGSRFTLQDGTVNTGPANLPLKEYQAIFDGNQVIHITN